MYDLSHRKYDLSSRAVSHKRISGTTVGSTLQPTRLRAPSSASACCLNSPTGRDSGQSNQRAGRQPGTVRRQPSPVAARLDAAMTSLLDHLRSAGLEEYYVGRKSRENARSGALTDPGRTGTPGHALHARDFGLDSGFPAPDRLLIIA